MKMNKKGFTLIEMLVVIAIIAVLVSIIIPTVTSATDKAAAATNAANLRSAKAEATTAFLAGDDTKYEFTLDDDTGDLTAVAYQDGVVALTAKAMNDDVTNETEIEFAIGDGEEIIVTFGGYDIDDFAEVAEKGGDLAHVGKNVPAGG